MTPIKPLLVPFVTTTSVLTIRFLLMLVAGGGINEAPPYGNAWLRAGLILPKSFVADLGVTEIKAVDRATKTPLLSVTSRLCRNTKRDRKILMTSPERFSPAVSFMKSPTRNSLP
jgi:hypothetical protein